MSNNRSRKILSHYLDQVVFPHMVYLQSGPEKKISSIFQVVNPLTGKIFTVDDIQKVIKDKVDKLRTYVNDMTTENNNKLAEKDYERLPSWDASKSRLSQDQFSEVVRQYVRAFHPAKKLLVLNAVQRKTPFMLLNPLQKFTGANYGYADLLRFLCSPVKTGEVAHFIQNGANPFYQPIRYPQPDPEGNQRLAMIMLAGRQFYFKKLAELRDLDVKFKSRRLTLEEQMDLIDKMVHVLKEVYMYRMNPLTLSQADPNQRRPMESYNRDNYLNLLLMLTSKKRAVPITFGEKPPKENTGVAFINPELRVASKATYE